MITDRYISKNGKEIKKVQLLYIDGDESSCDGCDELKKCARIEDISGNIIIICKDCLIDILEQF